MDLHEHQTKELLREYHVAVAEGELCATGEEASLAAIRLGAGAKRVIVKAQILAGGRGKAGGIIPADSPEQAKQAAEKLLGRVLVTPQTGASGKLVRKVYVEAGSQIERELYFAFTLNRSRRCISCIFSPTGGVNIEDPGHSGNLFRQDLEPGFSQAERRGIWGQLVSPPWLKSNFPHLENSFLQLAGKLQKLFIEKDLLLLEINPLAILPLPGAFLPLDAKATVDDNALFRHPELEKLRESEDLDSQTKEAQQAGLSYVGLEGNIGCLVNGAGLAMATLDLIKEKGGSPANFLDIGGGVSEDGIRKAFGILSSDKRVRAIFVNIFGGIVRCDLVATSIIEASRAVKTPMVIRLQGSRCDEAMDLLRASGLAIEIFSDLGLAAARAAELAHEHTN